MTVVLLQLIFPVIFLGHQLIVNWLNESQAWAKLSPVHPLLIWDSRGEYIHLVREKKNLSVKQIRNTLSVIESLLHVYGVFSMLWLSRMKCNVGAVWRLQCVKNIISHPVRYFYRTLWWTLTSIQFINKLNLFSNNLKQLILGKWIYKMIKKSILNWTVHYSIHVFQPVKYCFI